MAAELIGRALRGLGGARGQYLAQGVTVTSFVPMRAIPFRVVFVVGLGQGNFPAGERRSELDLRAARRQLGDVTPREQDLYMFLETLLSARDRLVLSYVARDELTGAPLAPVVGGPGAAARSWDRATWSPTELATLSGAGSSRPPLRRYDDLAPPGGPAAGAREQRAKALGRSLRQALPPGSAMPDLPALRRALAARARWRR